MVTFLSTTVNNTRLFFNLHIHTRDKQFALFISEETQYRSHLALKQVLTICRDTGFYIMKSTYISLRSKNFKAANSDCFYFLPLDISRSIKHSPCHRSSSLKITGHVIYCDLSHLSFYPNCCLDP